jgi:hypothetical protein
VAQQLEHHLGRDECLEASGDEVGRDRLAGGVEIGGDTLDRAAVRLGDELCGKRRPDRWEIDEGLEGGLVPRAHRFGNPVEIEQRPSDQRREGEDHKDDQRDDQAHASGPPSSAGATTGLRRFQGRPEESRTFRRKGGVIQWRAMRAAPPCDRCPQQ